MDESKFYLRKNANFAPKNFECEFITRKSKKNRKKLKVDVYHFFFS